jgi:hypothetical protein
VLAITTAWEEFKALPWQDLNCGSTIVLDCWRTIPQPARGSFNEYITLGFGSRSSTGAHMKETAAVERG